MFGLNVKYERNIDVSSVNFAESMDGLPFLIYMFSKNICVNSSGHT